MILSNKQAKTLFFGAIDFPEADGWLAPSRFTPEQRETFIKSDVFTDRACATASIGLRIRTNAASIAFDYKLVRIVHRWSMDVYVDGVLYQVVSLEEMPDEGHIHIALPEGDKRVRVNLPVYAQMMLKNLEINGKYRAIRRSTKVLWYGDSITQGASARMPGGSYVNLTAEAMGWDVLNHAIGGLQIDARHMLPMDYKPDKIVVSLGTNGCQNEDFPSRAENFYKKLAEVYPGVPVLAILPLWRQALDAWEANQRNADIIRAITSAYPNIRIIDGCTLVPNVPEMFTDGTHPTDLGMAHYSANLVKTIRKLKF